MKKVLVLISVAAVLFASGCVNPFGTTDMVSTAYALQVNVFEPDFP